MEEMEELSAELSEALELDENEDDR